MPKSVTRSQALGSSAFRKDIVLPEHAPPCNQSRFAIHSSLKHCHQLAAFPSRTGIAPVTASLTNTLAANVNPEKSIHWRGPRDFRNKLQT
jgi:hypothetical protein